MPDEAAIPEIEVEKVHDLLASGAVLIDVREQYEWDAGHSPVARLLPMSEITGRLGDLPQQKQLLVICQSGMRSQRVTQYLLQEGYDVVNVAGGMLAWHAAGLDVVVSPAA